MLEEASPGASGHGSHTVANSPVAQTKTLIRAQKHCLVWQGDEDVVVIADLSSACSLCPVRRSCSDWARFLPFAQRAGNAGSGLAPETGNRKACRTSEKHWPASKISQGGP